MFGLNIWLPIPIKQYKNMSEYKILSWVANLKKQNETKQNQIHGIENY